MTALALKTHPAMVRLIERVIERREQTRRETEWLMRSAPHDGRPPMHNVVRRASVANAQEVRASERWTPSMTPRRDGSYESITGVPLWLIEGFGAADAIRIAGSLARTVTVKPERTSKTTRRTAKVNPSTERAARLREAAGTIRMGEQD